VRLLDEGEAVQLGPGHVKIGEEDVEAGLQQVLKALASIARGDDRCTGTPEQLSKGAARAGIIFYDEHSHGGGKTALPPNRPARGDAVAPPGRHISTAIVGTTRRRSVPSSGGGAARFRGRCGIELRDLVAPHAVASERF